ncbi:MAG: phosphoglucosamine mutase [Armatimonadetes bacterium]|nr:phosphoglucosamine mutase [Armatimonadota bacterium]
MKSVQTLKISISGVRGVVGESLTPDLLVRFAQAYGTYVNSGLVVVGTDTRTSRQMVKHAVLSGLLSTGCEVIDLGIVPVPTVQMEIVRRHATGGIAVTASHNPAQWNALKFFRGDGIYLSGYQAEELVDIYHQGQYRRAPSREIRPVRCEERAAYHHLEAVYRLMDMEAVRRRRLKVVVDCCNGAASSITPHFLQHLGCEVIPINVEPNGIFPHPPEPIPENLVQLSEAVRTHGAAIGFVQDADADRLAIVDEHGDPIGEEYSVALATEYVLRHRKGPVVVNLSTTALIERIAERHGCKVYRTPVGEVNVVEEMQRRNAVIGGEGSGGVIWPALHLGRDSFSGMALALQLLAETGESVSDLVRAFPQFVMLKSKTTVATEQAHALLRDIHHHYRNHEIDARDGLKIGMGEGWVHVRASRTEPVIRVTVEAEGMERAKALQAEALGLIQRRTALDVVAASSVS